MSNPKRKAILLGAIGASALYLFLLLGPAIGGHITVETPAASAAK